MIAINSGISIAAIPQRRIRWPWVSATLILLAFLLGAHDLQASRRWFKTDKADIRLLAQEESNGRASRQIGFLLLGAVGLMLLTRPAGIALAPNPLIVLPLSMLLIWALISAGWSADPVITLKREVMLLCMLLAAAGLVKHFPVSLLSEIALAHSLFVILLGFTVELVLHSTVPGSEYRFAGTLHPNHMAINASLLLLCSLFIAFDRQDRRFLIIAAVAVATLLMTRSRTALASAIVGSFAFIMLACPPRKRFAFVLLVVLAGALALAVFAGDFFASFGQTLLMNRAGSDPTTLTGRTMIWQFAYDRIRDDWGRMLCGFGYGGFWTRETSQALSQRAHFVLAEGHNAYLDIMLTLGLIGLGLYVCCMLGTLCTWAAAARRYASCEAALAVGLLCFALNHHLAESAMTAPTFPTLVLWCVIGSAALHREPGANLGGRR